MSGPKETYNSSTHGEIPLSFTRRRLLANLRSAAEACIRNYDWHANGQALSRARGELALYMSKLEGRTEAYEPGWRDPRRMTAEELAEDYARAFREPWVRVVNDRETVIRLRDGVEIVVRRSS